MGPPRTPAERRAARSVVARDHIDRYTRLAEHSAEDARFVVYAVERDASDGIHTQPLVVWLENAIKYSDDGDIHLRIGVGEHEGRPITILSVRNEASGWIQATWIGSSTDSFRPRAVQCAATLDSVWVCMSPARSPAHIRATSGPKVLVEVAGARSSCGSHSKAVKPYRRCACLWSTLVRSVVASTPRADSRIASRQVAARWFSL